MKIERERWVIMRNNRKEVMCGVSKNHHFKPINDIRNASVNTYQSKAKAISSFELSWYNIDFEYEAVEVKETLEFVEERK